MMEEDVIVIFEPVQGSRCKFTRRGTAGYDKPKGIPATVKETPEGHLKLREVGQSFAQEGNGEFSCLRECLLSYGGAWTWDGLVLPEDMRWVA